MASEPYADDADVQYLHKNDIPHKIDLVLSAALNRKYENPLRVMYEAMGQLLGESPASGSDMRNAEGFRAAADLLPLGSTRDVVAALSGGCVVSLQQQLPPDTARVEPLTLAHPDGLKVYHRSIRFLLAMACQEVFPDRALCVEHAFALEETSLSNGEYCTFKGVAATDDDVLALTRAMNRLVKEDLHIEEVWLPLRSAPAPLCHALGQFAGYSAQAARRGTVACQRCRDYVRLWHWPLVPSTGRLTTFALQHVGDGFVVRFPNPSHPSRCSPFTDLPSLREVHDRAQAWGAACAVTCIGDLNAAIVGGHGAGLVAQDEAKTDGRIAAVARSIAARTGVRLVLIAGPSASGKTTFAAKLSLALQVAGVAALPLSTDDYYRCPDEPDYPRTSSGAPDHEVPEALRLHDLNDHLLKLAAGEEVETPIFDMVAQKPKAKGRMMRLPRGGVLVMEGIFCLNPDLTQRIAPEHKFRIFIAPISQVRFDDLEWLSHRTLRLLRRISRDFLHRGRSASSTLGKWDSVRRGEELNILPNLEGVDYSFNSSSTYELAVLKVHCMPLLETVSPDDPMFQTAQELMSFLTAVQPLSDKWIPPTAILREFVGGSEFEVTARRHAVAPPPDPGSRPLPYQMASNFPEVQTMAEFLPAKDIIASAVGGQIMSLRSPLPGLTSDVQPVHVESAEGIAVYRATLRFLLSMACKRLYPTRAVRVWHAAGSEAPQEPAAYVCGFPDLEGRPPVQQIKDALTKLIQEDVPIHVMSLPTADVLEYFERGGDSESASLLKARNLPFVQVNKCQDVMKLHLVPLAPSTGYTRFFDLQPHNGHMLLCTPPCTGITPTGITRNQFTVPPILHTLAADMAQQSAAVGIRCAGDLNASIQAGEVLQVVQLSEALHMKKLMEVVDAIAQRGAGLRAACIGGPPCAGTLTFAAQLKSQLMAAGIPSTLLCTDVYCPADTPEAADAFDLQQFGKHVRHLLSGKEVAPPGSPLAPPRLTLPDRGLLLVHGALGLHPSVLGAVGATQCFRVCVAPVTRICLDELTLLPPDALLAMRRVLRDFNGAGVDAATSLGRCSAAAGQGSLAPFLDGADAFVNSAADYEIMALRMETESLLRCVRPGHAEFAHAARLLDFVGHFYGLSRRSVPGGALVQEFLGNSLFEAH